MNAVSSVFAILIFSIGCSFSTVIAQSVVSSIQDIPQAGRGFASAYYDSATGDIYISAGDDLALLGLDGAPFGFVLGQFDPGRVSQDTDLGVPTRNNEIEISWLNLDGPLATGIFNVGSLLPPDFAIRDANDFDAAYPDARFSFAAFGNGNRAQFNVISPETLAIPEPSSFLPGMVVVGRMLVRRRRTF